MKGIYKITSPTGKVYVGQSIDIDRRKKLYAGKHCYKQQKLFASICKHGFESHLFEVIEECEEQLLNEREEFWIEQLETFNNKNGLNLQSGGLNKRVSNETKAKISKGNTGRKRPDLTQNNKKRTGTKLSKERVEQIRQSITGKKHSDATKEKMRLARLGWEPNEETKIKMSQSAKAKVLSKEHTAKLHEWAKSGKSRWRKVIDNKTGKVYQSLKEAAEASGFAYGYFKGMMSGRIPNKTTYNYYT